MFDLIKSIIYKSYKQIQEKEYKTIFEFLTLYRILKYEPYANIVKWSALSFVCVVSFSGTAMKACENSSTESFFHYGKAYGETFKMYIKESCDYDFHRVELYWSTLNKLNILIFFV